MSNMTPPKDQAGHKAPDLQKRFGAWLRIRRTEKRLTLEKLARAVGITFAYLAKIERGEMPPPPEHKLHELARVLEVSRDEIYWAAGRVTPEVLAIIMQCPREMSGLVSLVDGASREELLQVIGIVSMLRDNQAALGQKRGRGSTKPEVSKVLRERKLETVSLERFRAMADLVTQLQTEFVKQVDALKTAAYGQHYEIASTGEAQKSVARESAGLTSGGTRSKR